MEVNKADNKILYIVISAAVTFVYFREAFKANQYHESSNLLLYAGALGVFLLVYHVVYFWVYILTPVFGRRLILNYKISAAMGVVLLLGGQAGLLKLFTKKMICGRIFRRII